MKRKPLKPSERVGELSVCTMPGCVHPLLRNGKHVRLFHDNGVQATTQCLNALLEAVLETDPPDAWSRHSLADASRS